MTRKLVSNTFINVLFIF